MPKFRVLSKDPRGAQRGTIDFPDEQSAASDAQRALVDMASEVIPNGDRADFRVQVDDASGEEVYRASLKFRGRTRRRRKPVTKEPSQE